MLRQPEPWDSRPRQGTDPRSPTGDKEERAPRDGVVLRLSPEARALLGLPAADDRAARRSPGRRDDAATSPAEERQIAELQRRDAEVRAHEAAHASAAGGLGGAPSFEYKQGPDGRLYAVGGEVQIDLSPGRTPEETIRRAQQIRAAAVAPANPSVQDMAVAGRAAQMEADARAELQRRPEERRQAAVRAREQAQLWRPPSVEGERPAAARAGDAGSPASDAGDARSRSPVRDDLAALAEPTDPATMLALLARERVASSGGAMHMHQSLECGFCSKAARSYA